MSDALFDITKFISSQIESKNKVMIAYLHLEKSIDLKSKI